MRACTTICALFLSAATLLAPSAIGRDRVPWQVEFKERYERAEYAKIGIQVYRVREGSRTITRAVDFLSRTTGLIDEGYYFSRCAGTDNVFLSTKKAEDEARLHQVRFVKKGDPLFEKYEKYYREKCLEPLGPLYFHFQKMSDWWKTL